LEKNKDLNKQAQNHKCVRIWSENVLATLLHSLCGMI